MDVLATVFDKRLAKHLNKTSNPFHISPETPFIPPQYSTSVPEASSGNKKNQDKKKKQPSIAETLSARSSPQVPKVKLAVSDLTYI